MIQQWKWARCVGVIGTIALAASSAFAGVAPPGSKVGNPLEKPEVFSAGLQSHIARSKQTAAANTWSKPVVIANSGQWDSRARFYAAGPGADVWVTDSSIVIDYFTDTKQAGNSGAAGFVRSGHVVEMSFAGGSVGSKATGSYALPAPVNYITPQGEFAASQYQAAVIKNVYPSIDTYLYFDGISPRYDIVVNPGGNPSKVALKFSGNSSVRADSKNLYVGTAFGEMRVGGLYAYQLDSKGAKKTVTASFKKGTAGIQIAVGTYDKTKPLYMDPVVYSTLLGGTNANDIATSVAADSDGYAYVTGTTDGPTFPTTLGAYQESQVGVKDAFVTKLTKDGSGVIYSTHIGKAGSSLLVNSIAADVDGTVLIAGNVSGNALPAGGTAGLNSAPLGGVDGFILRLNATGTAIAWSTYVGGAGDDQLCSIKLDDAGNIHFAGTTTSVNLPTVNADQPAYGGGAHDGFVGTLNSSGTAYGYLTYLGGNGDEGIGQWNSGGNNVDGPPLGKALAVEKASGRAYVVTTTDSRNFKTTPGAYSTTLRTATGINDATITAYTSTGALIYSTSLGANNDDQATAVAVDTDGNAYVAGLTYSFNFPTTPGAYNRTWNLGYQMYVSKISTDGSKLVYSTFIPTSGGTAPTFWVNEMAVDPDGYVYLMGEGTDNTLPLVNSEAVYKKKIDAFVSVVNPTASALYYSTYFGSDDDDIPFGLAMDPGNSVYMVGKTNSAYPTTAGSFKPSNPGDGKTEGFVTKFKIRPPVEVASIVVSPASVIGGVAPSPTAVVNLTRAAGPGGALVVLSSNDTAATIQPSVLIPEGSTASDPLDITTKASLSEPVHVTFTAQLSSSGATTVLVVSPWLDKVVLSTNKVAGGNVVQGTVSLAAAAPAGGLDIDLTSSNAAATVPSTVHLDEGATSATFDVTTTSVTAETPLVISAQYENATRNASLTVRPAMIQSFTIDPGRVAGGSTARGTITLDGKSSGVTIHFTSDSVAVPAPSDVTIDAGASSVGFDIPTNSVASLATATMTATLGTQTVTALLTVQNVKVSSLTITPNSGKGGATLVGKVTLATTAQYATPVTLSVVSGSSSAVSFPATVTVPARARTVSFNITLNSVTVDTPVTIEAAVGTNSTTATLTVLATKISSITVTPSSLVGGTASAYATVTLDSPAPVGGQSVTLASNDSAATIAPTVVIPAGSTRSAAVEITTSAVTSIHAVTITASMPSGSKTAQLTLRPASVGSITFSPSKLQGGNGAYTTMTISLVGVAPAGGATINLTASSNGILTLGAKTIPAGQSSASFQVPVAKVSRNVTVKVTGTYGGSSASGSVAVIR